MFFYVVGRPRAAYAVDAAFVGKGYNGVFEFADVFFEVDGDAFDNATVGVAEHTARFFDMQSDVFDGAAVFFDKFEVRTNGNAVLVAYQCALKLANALFGTANDNVVGCKHKAFVGIFHLLQIAYAGNLNRVLRRTFGLYGRLRQLPHGVEGGVLVKREVHASV